MSNEPSKLQSLYANNSRQLLTSQSSFSSFSRRSTSSLLSFGSDLQSSGSSSKGKRQFKPISYYSEKRQTTTQDVLHHYQRITRTYKAMISSMIEEKGKISTNMEREKAHIHMLIQENEQREQTIRDTLAILHSGQPLNKHGERTPTISQLRRISDAILREGVRFKKQSENPRRIERETAGASGLSEKSPIDFNQQPPEDASYDRIMEYQRNRLSTLAFQRENSKMRLETVMSNRDMLNRMIFDHKTAQEALKVKKLSLTEEAKKLEADFEALLKSYAQKLGEMMWKNEIVKYANEIAKAKA